MEIVLLIMAIMIPSSIYLTIAKITIGAILNVYGLRCSRFNDDTSTHLGSHTLCE